MTIREHIDAGHYPIDDRGRALVPMKEHGTLLVLATDMPGHFPIVGLPLNYQTDCTFALYTSDGLYQWGTNHRLPDLLPPSTS